MVSIASTPLRKHKVPPAAQLQSNAARAARFLKAMANSSRLMVLCQLASGEKAVGELERVVRISQSALSQHLAVLRREGLAKTRRDGQTILYSLAGEDTVVMIDALYTVFCRKAAKRGTSGKRGRAAA